MEWIDFELELFQDPDHVYKPLVRAWWQGDGFAGRCPSCQGWIRVTTRRMEAIAGDIAATVPQLPNNWSTVAQFA